jgi:hypothetical protein
LNKAEIEKSIKEKETSIWELKQEVINLKKLLLPITTGLNEGDVVVNRKGERGIICYNGNETYWWGVRKIKKDGTPSDTIQNAYNDWAKESK